MAISDRWSLNSIRAACQRELSDPSARFWSTDELDLYISDWQEELQSQCEFVWGSNTQTLINTSTIVVSSLTPEPLRIDRIIVNGVRIGGRTKQDLEEFKRNWRSEDTITNNPLVAYQNDTRDIVLWPPITGTATVVLEYPTKVSFATGTSTMSIPAWTKYSAMDYVPMRALMREGPANSPNKALRYKERWTNSLRRIKHFYETYFPARPLTLKPSTTYEDRIINPARKSDLTYE